MLQSVKDDTNHDEKRGAAVELGELSVHTKETYDGREDSDNGKEEGAGEGDLGEDFLKVLSGLFSRFHTRYETTVFLMKVRSSSYRQPFG